MSKQPTTVHITMVDKNGDGRTTDRTIDISNICYQDGDRQLIAQSREKQRELLYRWIKERGNDQHSTSHHKASLSLVDWVVY